MSAYQKEVRQATYVALVIAFIFFVSIAALIFWLLNTTSFQMH